MKPISLLPNPTTGIESIGRFETGRTALPAAGDAQIVGGRVAQSAPSLYYNVSVHDVARQLIAPRIPDPSVLLPNRFEAAFYDLVDKMESQTRRRDSAHPALVHLRELREVREVCRQNLLAVNLV